MSAHPIIDRKFKMHCSIGTSPDGYEFKVGEVLVSVNPTYFEIISSLPRKLCELEAAAARHMPVHKKADGCWHLDGPISDVRPYKYRQLRVPREGVPPGFADENGWIIERRPVWG